MRRLCLLSLVLVSLVCLVNCESSPTNSVVEVVDPTGTWTGTVTINSVSGAGCYGALYQTSLPLVSQVTLNITSDGSTYAGTISFPDENRGGVLAVSLDGNRLSFEMLLANCSYSYATCPNGTEVGLCADSVTFEGTVDGNNLSGDYTEVFLSTVGNPLTFRGNLAATR